MSYWEIQYLILSILLGIKRTSEISCPSRVPPWNHVSALAPQFVFILSHITFLLFCPLLLTTALNHVHLKRNCNTIAFLQSSSLHNVNARGSVIALPGGFLSWHIPLRRCNMFINLSQVKTGTCFSRESLLFKWINRVHV